MRGYRGRTLLQSLDYHRDILRGRYVPMLCPTLSETSALHPSGLSLSRLYRARNLLIYKATWDRSFNLREFLDTSCIAEKRVVHMVRNAELRALAEMLGPKVLEKAREQVLMLQKLELSGGYFVSEVLHSEIVRSQFLTRPVAELESEGICKGSLATVLKIAVDIAFHQSERVELYFENKLLFPEMKLDRNMWRCWRFEKDVDPRASWMVSEIVEIHSP